MTAYETFQSLERGNKTMFNYCGESFHVRKVKFRHVEITDKQGNVAECHFYFSALLDYQGIAANLQTQRKHLKYNEQGNEI